jgi:simple sugar transport system substrate-binding protein
MPMAWASIWATQMMDSGTDPAEIKNKVLAYLSANPETDAS